MAEKEKPSRLEQIAPIVLPVTVVIVVVAVIVSINVWPHYFGATAEDVANVDLATTPKALAKAMPASEKRSDEVRVKFRHTVVGFEETRFYWEHSGDHVSRMKLIPEREKDDGKKGKLEHDTSPKSLEGRLANWAPGIDHGSYRWGAVKLAASDDGELSFSIDESPSDDHSVNSMFAKQVEAARQVIVAVAFEIQPTLSAKEIADALGSGYPLADVAKIDVSMRKPQALAAIQAQFPASLVEESKVRIPVAFPGLRNVTIRWSSSSQSRPRLEFSTTTALQGSLGSLQTCVATKTQSLSIRGNAVDVTISGDLDNATFSSVLLALDACKSASATAGGSH
jgi:hypothetical protein